MLEIGTMRADFYEMNNVKFILSKEEETLPLELKEFDFAVCNALIEHLLPSERYSLLSDIWKKMNIRGILFVSETPNRFFPIELHTTNLPLINYLPDKLTHYLAIKFSKNVNKYLSWEELLKSGIRGTTKGEIFAILNTNEYYQPFLLDLSEVDEHSQQEPKAETSPQLNQFYGGSAEAGIFLTFFPYLYSLFKTFTSTIYSNEISMAIMKTKRP